MYLDAEAKNQTRWMLALGKAFAITTNDLVSREWRKEKTNRGPKVDKGSVTALPVQPASIGQGRKKAPSRRRTQSLTLGHLFAARCSSPRPFELADAAGKV